MSGTALMNRCLMALSRAGASVFRNNTGQGWAGKSFSLSAGQVYRAHGGERVILDARPLKAGLTTGSSDIIGFLTVEVTPEMVGAKVAVFLAPEVKDGTGRPTKDQLNFLDHVRRGGGIADVVRSEADAVALVEDATKDIRGRACQ
jgi:hypothetical protein